MLRGTGLRGSDSIVVPPLRIVSISWPRSAITGESNKVLINGSADVTFDEYSGIIDEGLYGIGIAFPPTGVFNGQKIAKNGLYTYLVYAKKLIPRWVSNDKAYLLVEDDVEIPWI